MLDLGIEVRTMIVFLTVLGMNGGSLLISMSACLFLNYLERRRA